MEYKHKITGHIAKLTSTGKNYKVTFPQSFTIPKWIVENSNDWVLEKKTTSRINTVYTEYNQEFKYYKGHDLDVVKICSVYNSKDELFHIGDIIKINSGYLYQIEGFEIENDLIYCNFEDTIPKRPRKSIDSITLEVSKKEIESEKIFSIADLLEMNHGNNETLCIRFDAILEKFRNREIKIQKD